MKLVFDEQALVDLEGIYNWIAKDNPTAAKAVVERLFASTEHLATFPQMGHPRPRRRHAGMGGAAAAIYCDLRNPRRAG